MSPDEICVTVNTLHDLEQALKDSDRVVAMVYVTWCPYCRKALPVFEKQAAGRGRQMLLVADDEEHVADAYGIDIFPTLLLFEKGLPVKRLDSRPGQGLNDKQIADFVHSCFLV